ncbi:hypothetical protein K439DRAFT_1611122 [Ramaria rubella]|nr:hypothetical protein K439DRAFT_1611122 [Ramaria rubella]
MAQGFSVKFSLKIEKLMEGDWVRWSHEVRMALQAQKAQKCIDSTSQKKPPDTKLQEVWIKVNDQIVSALSTIVDALLQCELESITEAAEAWQRLKEKTQLTGIIAKLKSMQSAIRNHFSLDVPFSMTITEICDALGVVFSDKPPTADDWEIVLLLNVLSDSSYDWLRKDLITFMMNSKVQLSVKDVIEEIETEAREVWDLAKWEDSALVARGTKKKDITKVENQM